jgi:glycosyltransferase involved in cell wall biosynthesis
MPRRILLLITDLQIGGTPTVVRELALRLREPGRVEVEVACLAEWGPVADQLRDAGVAVTALGASSVADFPMTLVRLTRLIRARQFDTVFSFLIHANAVAAVASVACPSVRFIQSIQTTQSSPRWHWVLQRFIRVMADCVVVPSASAANVARRWAGVPAEQVRVIANAVEVQAFDAIATSRQQPGDVLRVGFLGRLDPVKRVPSLVDAMTFLPGAELHIFGEGSERQVIQTRINRHQLHDRVTLHGAVASPRIALEKIDVLVLPSVAEGFGLVLIEAMAAGVPVVAADAPGIRDVVRDGANGVLCGDASPARIAQAIRQAVDPQRRQLLIENAGRDVRERFGWESVLAQYRRLLAV